MLISGFFSCTLLLVQSAICSDLHHDPLNDDEELARRLLTDTNLDTYGYNHPPVPEVNVQEGSRRGKSININEETTSRSPSTSIRRRGRPTTSRPSLEIPVQVIYETVPTTVRSTSEPTISPSERTTRVFVRRRKVKANTNKENDIRPTTPATRKRARVSSKVNVPIFTEKDKSFVSTTELPKRSRGNYSNSNKKIDIRQTTPATSNITVTKVTDKDLTMKRKEESDKSEVSATEFPMRSRDSYFKKRIGTPAPKVKILEESNFVYSHSGNFHYSFLGDDGTKVSSEGSLKSYENNKTGESVSGSVFYIGEDGNDYSLSYTADENGYRPIGAHLPTPPPVPPAIARALKYIADKNASSTPSPTTKSE